MASPAGNPNQNPPPPFEMLFKPPPPNPNPNPNFAPNPNFPPNSNLYNPHSYPPPSPSFHHPHMVHYLHSPLTPNPNPNPGPNPGARLMALLGTTQPSHLESASSMPPPPPTQVAPAADHSLVAAGSAPTPAVMRLPSGKMPRGRVIGSGERAVYDIDVRMAGEAAPPQLEVTPITKYASDPGLVLGRQIAVNRTYICYGLKLGAIRVLNINTALRALLRGHSQRVTDMAFFAEDVHLLASASVDGRIFIWKIDEGPDNQSGSQITGKIIVAIQIVDGDSFHPRICWHSHKQEVLIVAIGNLVLKIDAIKVGRGKEFSAEEPLKCSIEKLIDGVQLIGKHEGEITDLSISQWMTTRLASASKDGTVKIWDDRKAVPLAVLKPHEGLPVSSVAFLTSPHCPEHIVLITAGPLNREVKVWTSTSEDGWLLPSDSESWQCTQTLELRSSAEPRPEESFFNQVVVLPRASLILLANAKKNAIYAVHVDYGQCPASTRMDYVADFTVTMPILSVTGTSDILPDGEQVVQVYCVQTQAIQQYALDLAQCSPPIDALLSRDSGSRNFDKPGTEEFSLEASNTVSAHQVGSTLTKAPSYGDSYENKRPADFSVVTSSPEAASIQAEASPSVPPVPSSSTATVVVVSSPGPLNMDLSSGISLLKNPSKGVKPGASLGDRDVAQAAVDHSAEGRVDVATASSPAVSSKVDNSVIGEPISGASDDLVVPVSHLTSKLAGNTTHLVTPSEILSGAISSTESTIPKQGQKGEELKAQEGAPNNNTIVALDRKLEDESQQSQHQSLEPMKEPQGVNNENKEKPVNNITSDADSKLPKDRYSLSSQTSAADEALVADVIAVPDAIEQSSVSYEEESEDKNNDGTETTLKSCSAISQPPAAEGNKQKLKKAQVSAPSPPLSSYNSTELNNEPGNSTFFPSNDVALPQFQAMQETLNQLLSMQKEMQNQMRTVVDEQINKESKRVEASLGRNMEKSIKANFDALWARFQEENAKQEKAERERMQQLTNLMTTSLNKDIPSALERVLKKEMGTVLARAVNPVIEKCISSAVSDCFQRGVGDKAVSQLEKTVNSKLETTVTRQIQGQFQTSGKQALQEALRSSLETSVIPAFERSCKAMFEQVDTVFQKGMSEHTNATQQHFESAHTPLVLTLRDAINSASSITQNLTSEIADGQRKILALLADNTKAPLGMQQTNGPMTGIPDMALSVQQVEAPLDPTKELSRLISEHKYGDAFTAALQRSDVSIVSWLCSQVDLQALCSMVPLPLNQGVLLALLQQLACDISTDTSRKLGWMTDVAVAINPTDPLIVMHVRPIFEQVYNILAHQRSLPTTSASEATSLRVIMHVINSVLLSCK